MTRVLIIDDAATVRLFHRKVLEGAGFVVDEAINGLEALEKVTTGDYALCVVDINMPLQNGYLFVEKLRALPIKALPALMISTQNRPADQQNAWRVGANFYLSKPVKAATLKQAAVLMSGGLV